MFQTLGADSTVLFANARSARRKAETQGFEAGKPQFELPRRVASICCDCSRRREVPGIPDKLLQLRNISADIYDFSDFLTPSGRLKSFIRCAELLIRNDAQVSNL